MTESGIGPGCGALSVSEVPRAAITRILVVTGHGAVGFDFGSLVDV